MTPRPHPTRRAWLALAAVVLVACAMPAAAEDSELDELLKNAKPATTPSVEPDPDAEKNDPLGTRQEKPPAGARLGVITFNDGKAIEGRIATTFEKPIRVWVDSLKVYRDIDFALIKRIDVIVVSEQMEDDWRWKKEGSDEKVYSGKKYPNVELAYKFTLLNDKTIEGTVVAPIYFADGNRRRQFALYKKYKGNLDETLRDVVYIKSVTLRPPAEAAKVLDGTTTKLPLITD